MVHVLFRIGVGMDLDLSLSLIRCIVFRIGWRLVKTNLWLWFCFTVICSYWLGTFVQDQYHTLQKPLIAKEWFPCNTDLSFGHEKLLWRLFFPLLVRQKETVVEMQKKL